MPRETCWSCKQVKDDVTLCADDRWCGDCARANERELKAIAADRTSSSTVPVATSSARSTRSTVVGRSTDDNAKISESLAAKSSDGPKKSGKSKQNEQKTRPASTSSLRQLAESDAPDGTTSILKTVTATSEVPAKVVTPSESESIDPSRGVDGICTCSFTAKPVCSRNFTLGTDTINSANVGTSPDVNSSGSESALCINELLSYVGFYRNKSKDDNLRRSVLSFFIPSDICQAKKLLSSKYATTLELCQFLAERRNSSTRAAHEAEIDDIIGMFDLLDLKN